MRSPVISLRKCRRAASALLRQERVVCRRLSTTHLRRDAERMNERIMADTRHRRPSTVGLAMPGCRLPPLRATVPTLLACCVGCVLFQSRLAMVHEEVSRMHEEGLFSRRVRLMPESLICPADGASAAPRELLSAEARKVRLRLLREQVRPEDPSLRQLLDSATQAPRSTPSVTVVLEFRSAAALCRQLESLLHQTVKAHAIWVSDFQSADGGAEARRLLANPNPQPLAPTLSPHPLAPTLSPRPLAPTLSPQPLAPTLSPQPPPELLTHARRGAWSIASTQTRSPSSRAAARPAATATPAARTGRRAGSPASRWRCR